MLGKKSPDPRRGRGAEFPRGPRNKEEEEEEEEEEGEDEEEDDDDDVQPEVAPGAGKGADDSDGEEAMGAGAGAFKSVVYCGVCGMPPEYCEWGPGEPEACAAWLATNHPGFFEVRRLLRGEGGL